MLHLGWSASSGGKPMSSLVVVGAGADAGSEARLAAGALKTYSLLSTDDRPFAFTEGTMISTDGMRAVTLRLHVVAPGSHIAKRTAWSRSATSRGTCGRSWRAATARSSPMGFDPTAERLISDVGRLRQASQRSY